LRNTQQFSVQFNPPKDQGKPCPIPPTGDSRILNLGDLKIY
jgi:hypothetical protein